MTFDGGHRFDDAVAERIALNAAEHARFEFDDAAYVLGALDAEERAAFEAHLADCPLCQQDVADLRALPDILHKAQLTDWTSEPPPETLLPRVLRRIEQERRRRLIRTWTTAFAAACLLAALAVFGIGQWRGGQEPRALAMHSTTAGGSPLVATVALSGATSGTTIRVKCDYETPGRGYATDPASRNYTMVVYNRAGDPPLQISGWNSAPEVDITTRTNIAQRDIKTIEIKDDRGAAVLRLDL